MLEFQTPGFQGYSTKYSPFIDSRLAVVAAANYGLVGNGRLYVLRLTSTGIEAEKWFDTQDSLFDLAWSETHENQVVVASGDGSIKLFDTSLDEFPIRSWHEHKREAFSVHWNLVAKDVFASSSWDGTIKVVITASAGIPPHPPRAREPRYYPCLQQSREITTPSSGPPNKPSLR